MGFSQNLRLAAHDRVLADGAGVHFGTSSSASEPAAPAFPIPAVFPSSISQAKIGSLSASSILMPPGSGRMHQGKGELRATREGN
jgi:hypothetical protein